MIRISNVIPTHNRKEVLLAHLFAIARQSMPPDEYEVIVVCDNCQDGTHEMLEDVRCHLPYRLVWASTPDGVSHARNLGVSASSGEIIVFHDDDVLPGRGCFRAFAEVVKSGVAAVGYISPDHQQRCESPVLPLWKQFQAGNCAVWRNDFLFVRGFDESVRGWGGEDHALAYALSKNGVSLRYIPSAEALHLWPVPYNIGPKSSEQKWTEAKSNGQMLQQKYGVSIFP